VKQLWIVIYLIVGVLFAVMSFIVFSIADCLIALISQYHIGLL
jgi:hypothetical protein